MLFSLLSGKMDFLDTVTYVLAALIVIFVTLPFHEFAHAFVADKLGDHTARYQGRLTVNPFVHMDYFGALALIVFGFGWAKPTPVNVGNFRKPKSGIVLTALAGPAMNLLLAFAAQFIYYGISKAFLTAGGLMAFSLVKKFLSWFSYLNIILAVYNLLPLPPLDGSRLLCVILPSKWYFAVMRYERYYVLAMILLIWLGFFDVPLSFLSNVFNAVVGFIPRLIFGF